MSTKKQWTNEYWKSVRTLTLLLLCLVTLRAFSADTYVQITLTVTNVPVTSNSIAINGNNRIWTNQTAATWILTNSVGVGPAASNLFNALNNFPQAPPIIITYATTNSFTIQGTNLSVIVDASGNWASLSGGTTNTIGTSYALMLPTSRLPSGRRVTNMTDIAESLGLYSTSPISGIRLTNVIGLNGTVTRLTNGYFTNAITDGGRSTNLYATNATLDVPTLTNAINYGNAFSSPGSGLQSEQFGLSANASGQSATAVGYGSTAAGLSSAAFGNAAEAFQQVDLAVGTGAAADGGNASAIGSGASASATNTIALGTYSAASFPNSTALGIYVETTASNQVRVGRSADTVSIPGRIEAASSTNTTTTGTNQWLGDVAYPMYAVTTLANGNNLAVPLTNVFAAVSGPTADFTINGIYGGRDGRKLRLLNRSGYTMTMAHQSGVDPTPANRIICAPAADQTFFDGEMVDLWYDGTSSRWRLSVHLTNAVAISNGIATIKTNGTAMSAAATSLNFLAGQGAQLIGTNTAGAEDLQIIATNAYSWNASQITLGGTGGTNVSISTGVAVTNPIARASSATSIGLQVKAASAATTNVLEVHDWGGYPTFGVYSNGVPFWSPSNSAVQYPLIGRVFNQTADGSCTNITTTETSWVGTGIGSMTLPANFWQVGRSLNIRFQGHLYTPASPGNSSIRIKLGSTIIATNLLMSLTGAMAPEIMDGDFTLTCRTNSASIGYIEAFGKIHFPTVAGSGASGIRSFRSTQNLFDTTASALLDLVSTNGAAQIGAVIKNLTVTVAP